MRAEIISVGTELLLGEIVDTNAAYLAQRLAPLGIDLYFVSQIGDNLARLSGLLRQAWSRSDLIIVTGGLGPTDDDLTRDAIASMLGERLSLDPQLEEMVKRIFSERRMPMPETNRRQAMIIPSAQAIENPVGTAPGWWVEREGHIIVAMPGVPFEMYRMWSDHVAPRLRQRHHGAIILSRTLKVFGIGEAAVGEKISDLAASANPTAATYAKSDGIHVRIAAKATSEEEAAKALDRVDAVVSRRLGTYIYGRDAETLESVIAGLLRDRQLTVATFEQATAGLLASMLTYEARDVFQGGLVAVNTGTLVSAGLDPNLLASYGSSSVEVARWMAAIARERFGADIGVATAGLPATSGDEAAAVAQMHYVVDNRGQVRSGGRAWVSAPSEFKRMATMGALNLLRLSVLEA